MVCFMELQFIWTFIKLIPLQCSMPQPLTRVRVYSTVNLGFFLIGMPRIRQNTKGLPYQGFFINAHRRVSQKLDPTYNPISLKSKEHHVLQLHCQGLTRRQCSSLPISAAIAELWCLRVAGCWFLVFNDFQVMMRKKFAKLSRKKPELVSQSGQSGWFKNFKQSIVWKKSEIGMLFWTKGIQQKKGHCTA